MHGLLERKEGTKNKGNESNHAAVLRSGRDHLMSCKYRDNHFVSRML